MVSRFSFLVSRPETPDIRHDIRKTINDKLSFFSHKLRALTRKKKNDKLPSSAQNSGPRHDKPFYGIAAYTK